MNGPGAIRSPRPRGRRGQVLIVGNGIELSHGLRWPRDPRHADNIFDALGELSSSTPSNPIATIAISSDHLRRTDSDPQLAVDALRRVDPSVRIVLLEASRHGREIEFDGFDERLHCPLRPEDLARLFDEDTPFVAPVAERPATIMAAPPPAAVDENPPAPRVPTPQPSVRTPEPPPVVDQVMPEPVHTKSELVAAPLGDTDLVEAILASPNGVQPVALQLMAQQTGLIELQFIAASSDNTPAAGAPAAPSVAVTRAGKTFGHLAASSATPQQLQPWAEWLAHWLALDDAHRTNRMLAFQDDLTGAWNRRFFNVFLRDSIARAAKVRRPVTVMVFDLDNFKSYNDDFGHAAGDEILRETVRLMNAVVRQGDRVCRIGGDEFAVVFADPEGPRKPGSTHPDSVEVIAKRFQDKVCSMSFPKLGVEAPGTLSISAGLATYPWDGHDPGALLRHADELALESKRKGKNAITFGPGAQRECGKQQ